MVIDTRVVGPGMLTDDCGDMWFTWKNWKELNHESKETFVFDHTLEKLILGAQGGGRNHAVGFVLYVDAIK